MITKTELDKLAAQFEVKDFIKDDPIQFPHRFKDKKDIEIAGFIASLLAYGNRKIFIRKLDELFGIMEHEPHNFILSFDPESLGGFNYRFGKEADFAEIFRIMRSLYTGGGGLEELFGHTFSGENRCCNDVMLKTVVDYFYSRVNGKAGHGFYHMIPNPENGGAMKRMNMYLRWMIRKGPVDLGIWNFMPASELLIPLDVHVARISREMGILTGKSNNMKAVIELTQNLKKFDPQDPVKYDFAMFGRGVSRDTGSQNLHPMPS
ncbi:MAG: TIGR02757 family protein [Heliobacteriaceae bacterium]|jgi:uncharacterized protein (TIGR02757 family)|nr:TIGR02757 family protein [Heliobacteriaceae bacterium]